MTQPYLDTLETKLRDIGNFTIAIGQFALAARLTDAVAIGLQCLQRWREANENLTRCQAELTRGVELSRAQEDMVSLLERIRNDALRPERQWQDGLACLREMVGEIGEVLGRVRKCQ